MEVQKSSDASCPGVANLSDFSWPPGRSSFHWWPHLCPLSLVALLHAFTDLPLPLSVCSSGQRSSASTSSSDSDATNFRETSPSLKSHRAVASEILLHIWHMVDPLWFFAFCGLVPQTPDLLAQPYFPTVALAADIAHSPSYRVN